MRLWQNLKWLFNHPPITITNNLDPDKKCDYCESYSHTDSGLWITNEYTICDRCRKKVFDHVLGEEQK